MGLSTLDQRALGMTLNGRNSNRNQNPLGADEFFGQARTGWNQYSAPPMSVLMPREEGNYFTFRKKVHWTASCYFSWKGMQRTWKGN